MTHGTHVAPTPIMPLMPLDVRRYEPNWVDDRSDGVAIVSGGMDSVTMVYHLVRLGKKPHLLSFDYGQRHKKELQFALWHAEALGLRWSLIDLTSITDLISNSALTSKCMVSPVYETSRGPSHHDPDGPQPSSNPEDHHLTCSYHDKKIEVPEGHYAEDNMRITVVPNRNMMMLSIAAAVAVNAKYSYVAAGMHGGDHFQYPDCRPDFILSLLNTVQWANEGFLQPNFAIKTPFIRLSKNDIASEALRCEVPLHMTWSCYKGEDKHCGRCGTCVERLEAIASVHNAPEGWDRTAYQDTEYWKAITSK